MVPRMIQTAAVAAILLAPGCVTSSPPVPHRHTLAPQSTAQCRTFVMWPVSGPSAFRGNVVVHPPEIESLVAQRIVELERERCPDSELVRPSRATPVAAIPGYAAAVNRTRVSALTTFELQAAASALDRGANYLVVPTIKQWNQNRTDDPIGAFVSPR